MLVVKGVNEVIYLWCLCLEKIGLGLQRSGAKGVGLHVLAISILE